ncbi:flagellin [Halostagnicola sp. A56]|uniref:flagellin n=1 Tax=Halostagnicola sp. A56 TaxID=1495067 RepID=UPI0004A0F5E8|nr:flagellin [Halostagnicola sp. A56]KDE59547.1 flagellin [Halostagnicola sp. A56]
MASVSATHIILFIASMVVAAGIAGTVVLEVDDLSGAIETQGSATASEIGTEIDIVSDAGHPEAIYDPTAGDGNVTVYVKNVGDEHLEAHHSSVDVLLDGRYVSHEYTELEHQYSESNTWQTGDVVALRIDVAAADDLEATGDTTVTVIANDNEDSIDFYVDGGSN